MKSPKETPSDISIELHSIPNIQKCVLSALDSMGNITGFTLREFFGKIGGTLDENWNGWTRQWKTICCGVVKSNASGFPPIKSEKWNEFLGRLFIMGLINEEVKDNYHIESSDRQKTVRRNVLNAMAY